MKTGPFVALGCAIMLGLGATFWAVADTAKAPAPPVQTDPTPLNKRPHQSIIFVLGLIACDNTYIGSLFVMEDGTADFRTSEQMPLEVVQQVATKLEQQYGAGHNGVFTYKCPTKAPLDLRQPGTSI